MTACTSTPMSLPIASIGEGATLDIAGAANANGSDVPWPDTDSTSDTTPAPEGAVHFSHDSAVSSMVSMGQAVPFRVAVIPG